MQSSFENGIMCLYSLVQIKIFTDFSRAQGFLIEDGPSRPVCAALILFYNMKGEKGQEKFAKNYKNLLHTAGNRAKITS